MENNVRNFYEEEAAYEQSILETKLLVEKVLNVNLESLGKKINKVDTGKDFNEYLNVLEATIGKDTDKFYYCTNDDDVKYFELIKGNVYSSELLNPELKSRIGAPKKLDLQARILLANSLYQMTNKLKEIFNNNIQVGDGCASTIDEDIIIKQDVDYLDNLLKYLELMQDEKGKLKIFVAEQDVFALNKAKEQYQKKSSFEKWFLKKFKQENATIQNMAKKNKEKK